MTIFCCPRGSCSMGLHEFSWAHNSWMSPLSTSLNFLARALVIGPIGTCTRSFEAVPWSPSLMSVHYVLHWIAFNSFVKRWTILTLISNECGGVIDFNGLLLIGLSITLLPIWRINLYSCHLWGTHLMYAVVIYYNDDARWTMLAWWMMLAFSSFGQGWFFSSI